MGSGKSTVATVLANLIGADRFDTDEMVAVRSAMTIAQIFERDGEAAFRALESDVLIDALREPGSVVIATGGGVVTSSTARDALKAHDGVVFLDVPVAVAASRVARDSSLRPLVGEDPVADLRRLEQQRRHLYEEVADVHIDGGDRSASEIAEEIVAWDRSRR